MKNKSNEYDYNLLASRFISDQTLGIKVQSNVTFVEKYLDKIDTLFKEEVEKHIAYREMGVIVFSCIEALLESALAEIKKRCRKHCHNKTCSYLLHLNYKFLEEQKNKRPNTLSKLLNLLDVRMFWVPPEDIDIFKTFSDLRNHVHIYKFSNSGVLDQAFSKTYVETLLEYYYNVLNQLNVSGWYFESDCSCLKELDGAELELTIKQNNQERKMHYLTVLEHVFYGVIYNKEPTDRERMALRIMGSDFLSNHGFELKVEDVFEILNRYSSCLVRTRKYNEIRDRLSLRLSGYFNEAFVVELIKKCDEIRGTNK